MYDFGRSHYSLLQNLINIVTLALIKLYIIINKIYYFSVHHSCIFHFPPATGINIFYIIIMINQLIISIYTTTTNNNTINTNDCFGKITKFINEINT